MKGLNNISVSVVIILLLFVLAFYVKAFARDLRVLNAKKQNQQYQKNTFILNSGYLNEAQKAEVKDICEQMQNARLHTHELSNGIVDGAMIGFLSGVIIGDYNVAITNSFVWAIVKSISIGISQSK